MNVQKFYGSSTRDALRKVRDALGPDAIILANRPVDNGIEIMAVADLDVSALARNGSPPAAVRIEPDSGLGRIDVHLAPPVSRESSRSMPPAAMAESTPTGAVAPEGMMPERVVQDIVREIRFLRGMVEGQLAGFAWSDLQKREPVKVELLRLMLAIGFSPQLSRQLLDRLPEGKDVVSGLKWLKTALLRNLGTVGPDDDLVERGGVYALVGPTGVGKTTTVAKLAARCTLKFGASRLALITTDSYRIGAHEQLRIYGKILGVPVHAVRDEADLQLTLADLENKHLVLIDTVGMSQRDRRLADQVALLSGTGRSVQRLLLLSATAQAPTLEDVVRAYNGPGMQGAILTKIDEAISLGGVLDVVVRHKLPLHFVTNGQRVPEDIHHVNLQYLLERTFRSAREASPFTLDGSEYPLIMAPGMPDDPSPLSEPSLAVAHG